MININQLIKNCPKWNKYIDNPFIQNIANESLDVKKFENYLIQDFIFLFNYAKIFSLLSVKANSINDFVFAINQIKSIEKEIYLLFKRKYSDINLQEVIVDNECQIYIGYLYQLSNSSSYIELLIALLPSIIGYYYIGKKLTNIIKKRPTHKFKKWIKAYSSKNFKNSVESIMKFFNDFPGVFSLERIQKFQETFNYIVDLEINFFKIGIK